MKGAAKRKPPPHAAETAPAQQTVSKRDKLIDDILRAITTSKTDTLSLIPSQWRSNFELFLDGYEANLSAIAKAGTCYESYREHNSFINTLYKLWDGSFSIELISKISDILEIYAAEVYNISVPDIRKHINRLAAAVGIADEDLPSFAKLVFDFAANASAAKREITTRENAARATAQPRLKWDHDRRDDENPATFAWRAYAAEAKAGTLHRGLIYSEDRELHRRLNSWLRTYPMPEGIDIPTLPEWNSRQLAKLAEPESRETLRLHQVARRRRERAAAAARHM